MGRWNSQTLGKCASERGDTRTADGWLKALPCAATHSPLLFSPLPLTLSSLARRSAAFLTLPSKCYLRLCRRLSLGLGRHELPCCVPWGRRPERPIFPETPRRGLCGLWYREHGWRGLQEGGNSQTLLWKGMACQGQGLHLMGSETRLFSPASKERV